MAGFLHYMLPISQGSVMHEMLGNQYFLTRNYQKARDNLVLALKDNPQSKPIRRKLIVCFTQIGQVDNALDVFLSLVKEDAAFIIDTDPVADDCPCPELVFDIEAKTSRDSNKTNANIILGILWLFCDVSRSIHHFTEARKLQPENPKIKSALSIITAKANLNKNDQSLTYNGGIL